MASFKDMTLEQMVAVTRHEIKQKESRALFTVEEIFGTDDNDQFGISKRLKTHCLDIFPYIDPERWKITIRDETSRNYMKKKLTWLFNRVYNDTFTEGEPDTQENRHELKGKGKIIHNVLKAIVNHDLDMSDEQDYSQKADDGGDISKELSSLHIKTDELEERVKSVEGALNVNTHEYSNKRSRNDQLVGEVDETNYHNDLMTCGDRMDISDISSLGNISTTSFLEVQNNFNPVDALDFKCEGTEYWVRYIEHDSQITAEYCKKFEKVISKQAKNSEEAKEKAYEVLFKYLYPYCGENCNAKKNFQKYVNRWMMSNAFIETEPGTNRICEKSAPADSTSSTNRKFVNTMKKVSGVQGDKIKSTVNGMVFELVVKVSNVELRANGCSKEDAAANLLQELVNRDSHGFSTKESA